MTNTIWEYQAILIKSLWAINFTFFLLLLFFPPFHLSLLFSSYIFRFWFPFRLVFAFFSIIKFLWHQFLKLFIYDFLFYNNFYEHQKWAFFPVFSSPSNLHTLYIIWRCNLNGYRIAVKWKYDVLYKPSPSIGRVG